MRTPREWWRARWTPTPEYQRVAAELRQEQSRAAKLQRKWTEAERRLDEHMRASKFVAARVGLTHDFAYGVVGARRLRCEVLVDDRVFFYTQDTNLVRDAVADEAAYKIKQGVMTLDFALARSVMSLKREWEP